MNEWGYSCHFIDAETEAQRGETLWPLSVSEGVSKPGSKPNLLSLSAATAQATPCLPHPGNETEATGHRMYRAEVKWEAEAEMFPQDKFEEIKIGAQNPFIQTLLEGKPGAANGIACFQIESQK